MFIVAYRFMLLGLCFMVYLAAPSEDRWYKKWWNVNAKEIKNKVGV